MHSAPSLTRLSGTLQGKSSAFSTTKKTMRGSNKIYQVLLSKQSWLRRKPQAVLLLFFFKKGGMGDMARQPKISRVFMFPWNPLAPPPLPQSEWRLLTKWSSVLLGSSNSHVPTDNSCPSVTWVHIFGTDRIHENNTVLSNHSAIQRNYCRQTKTHSQTKIAQWECNHEREERRH